MPNSERITAADGNVLVRGVDYQIDFYLGKITVGETGLVPAPSEPPTDKPSKLKIVYRTLPFAIKQVYKRDLYGTEVSDQHSALSTQQDDVPSPEKPLD